MPETATEYASLCYEHVGTIPEIDCGDGVRIPIFVGGKEVFEDPDPGQCDSTDFKKNCRVGSRIGRLEGRDADGAPVPDVVWVYFCRSAGRELFEKGIVSVQMIGHNTETGATCFLESPDAVGNLVQAEYLHFDDDGLLDSTLPGPGSAEFDRAWIPPPLGVECTKCHENDAFIHNPWIDGARLPSDPSEPVLPEVAGPDSPYFVLGGADWDLRTVHIEKNGCVSCHRVPVDIARIFAFSGNQVNKFMPPHEPGSLAEDYAALLSCRKQGPAKTPGCEWVIPPGGGCEGGVVSETTETTKKEA
jgi:hypothetical protein